MYFMCEFYVLSLLENWTSLDVTTSVTDTECVHCYDEESTCIEDHSTIEWDLTSSGLLPPPRRHATSAAGRRPRDRLVDSLKNC